MRGFICVIYSAASERGREIEMGQRNSVIFGRGIERLYYKDGSGGSSAARKEAQVEMNGF